MVEIVVIQILRVVVIASLFSKVNKLCLTCFPMSDTEVNTETDVYFQREVSLDSCDEVLTIDQKFECDVGCVVWDAALLLAKYLEFKSHDLGISGANVVELGAGTGFCGLMAATLGANVILSDLSYCLDIMHKNIQNNRHLIGDRVVAKEFDWSQTDPQKEEFFDWSLDTIDLIIVSDCIYYEEVTKPPFHSNNLLFL